MGTLRTFSLRTQFAIIVAFLAVFALGAGVSNWIRSEEQTGLAIAMHTDLAIATKLPRLKALLRSLDLDTSQYLRTGKTEWLQEHRENLGKIQKTQEDLLQLLPSGRERKILQDLDRQLAEHYIQESGWIRQKRAGSLGPGETAKILSSRRSYEDILEIALNMHDIDLQDLAGRSRAAHRASLQGFWLVLLVGLLASAVLSLGLSRYIIEPIRSLDDYTKKWKPGEPWTCEMPSVSPEINSLFRSMKGLMERLNEEYRKEKDMGRLKSQLVSTVSHELNNALSVIHVASVSLAETEPKAKTATREKMYRIIRGQTTSLARTINNLLNIGRLESGKLALARRRMDMGTVLQESVELVEALAENKKINISMSLPNQPLPVYADPDALTLVITNLLSNAIKYTPEEGFVQVGIAKDGRAAGEGFVRVYVKDTGIGIEPDEKEKIFSGYYRSERGKRLAKGFGIGLSLARSIITAHGGRLELDSTVGEGSTFFFTLPLWVPDHKAKSDSTPLDLQLA
jgi:signal transduction histidine kinase